MKLQATQLLVAMALTLFAGGAGAASMHQFDIAQTSGSGGALAIVQSSSGESAIQGQVGTPVDTSFKFPFGVYGNYSGTQFGIGVAGVSQTGYGVAAESFSEQPAMIALSKGGGAGIETINGDSATSLSSENISVFADIVNGVAGYFSSTATPSGNPAVEAYGFTGGIFTGTRGAGIFAYSDDYDGIMAQTNGCFSGCHGGTGVVGGEAGQGLVGYGSSGSTTAAIEADDIVGGSDLVAAYAYNGGSMAESFIVQSNTANASGHTTGIGKASDVQISGDVYVSGTVYQSCGTFPETSSTDCGSAAATSERTSNGSNVRMYAARESAPTVEDIGIAHLSAGRTHVPIDPAFARTMSRVRPYHVFLTPDGPSRGVYASSRSASGFDISENPGGSSTVDVEYRIVATPFSDSGTRLAELVPTHKAVLANEIASARTIAKIKAEHIANEAREQKMQMYSAERRAKIEQIEARLGPRR